MIGTAIYYTFIVIIVLTFPKIQEEASGSRMNESEEEEEENTIVIHQNSGSSSSSVSSSGRKTEAEDNQIDAGLYSPDDVGGAVDFQQRLQLSLAKVDVTRLDATCIQGATKVPNVTHAQVLTYGR